MKTVCHFVRKSTQLRASFIQNQILKHINYSPSVILKYSSFIDDGGFADVDENKLKILNLQVNENLKEKLLYRSFKVISKKDAKNIKVFLSKQNANIIHFHYGTDAGIYYPFMKQNHIPSIVSFYGYDCSSFPRRLFGYGKHYLQNRIFKYVTKVLAMSKDMKNDLIKIGCPEEKIIVHYHGSDVNKFYNNRYYRNENNEIRFLIISGLVPKKGHMFLLKSFKKAYRKNHHIRLKIVGEGPLRKQISDFTREHNMNYIELAGKVIYGSKGHMKCLENADVFVHPSVTDVNGDKEGIPGAIVEAMAMGLPIISTYHAGIPYVIQHGETGLLAKEWDDDGLSNQIVRLAEDFEYRKYLGINGQRYAIENLDVKVKQKELENIYDSLLN